MQSCAALWPGNGDLLAGSPVRVVFATACGESRAGWRFGLSRLPLRFAEVANSKSSSCSNMQARYQ